MASELSVAIL